MDIIHNGALYKLSFELNWIELNRWSNAENCGSVRFMVREKISSQTDGR